jgi:hypothetical protein
MLSGVPKIALIPDSFCFVQARDNKSDWRLIQIRSDNGVSLWC